jgi:anti-sigma B factor antagonist
MREILHISEKRVDMIDIISIKGRLDASSSKEVEEKLNGLIDDGNSEILINLEDLEYISSSGLRVMLAALKRVKKMDGNIGVACLKSSIKEVFTMAGFDRIFSIYSTEEEALKDFRSGN